MIYTKDVICQLTKVHFHHFNKGRGQYKQNVTSDNRAGKSVTFCVCCHLVKSVTFPNPVVPLISLDMTLTSCRDRVEEEEAGGGGRVWRPDGRGQDAAGAGAGKGWCKKKNKTTIRPFAVRKPEANHGVLTQIQSNLGRLILKEEKEKAVRYRRKTQSLPDRTHMHTSEPEDTFSLSNMVLDVFSASLWVLMCLLPCRSVGWCFQISFALQLRLDQSEFDTCS